MEDKKRNYSWAHMSLLVTVFAIMQSCGTTKITPDIMGTWKSDIHKITVRSKQEKRKFEFFTDSIITTLTINEDKTVVGNIGLAEINNGKISANWLLPSGMTGVAYTIKCHLTGNIFENDPIDKKEVQFWIGPNFKTDVWELRYTTGGSQFPMAFINFKRSDNGMINQ